MGQVIVSALMAADGVTDGPQDWASQTFDATDVEASIAALRRSDAFLMGRQAYEYFAPVWGPADSAYAEELRRVPKLVFTSRALVPAWHNTRPAGSDPVGTVGRLREESDGDIVVYGLTRLARTLLAAGLVDRLRLAVHPVLAGDGQIKFTEARVRGSGVVELGFAKALSLGARNGDRADSSS